MSKPTQYRPRARNDRRKNAHRRLVAREHVSNFVGIDELVTLISFPYIVGLSESAVNSRRELFMRSAGRGARTRARGRSGPSLKIPPFARGIVSFSPPVNCIRVRFYLLRIADFCREYSGRYFSIPTRLILFLLQMAAKSSNTYAYCRLDFHDDLLQSIFEYTINIL